MSLFKKKNTPQLQDQMTPIIGYERVYFTMDFIMEGKPRFVFWSPGHHEGEPRTPYEGMSALPRILFQNISETHEHPGSVILEVACSGKITLKGNKIVADNTRVLQVLLDDCVVVECNEPATHLQTLINASVLPHMVCEHHASSESLSMLPYVNRTFKDAYGNSIVMGYEQESEITVNNMKFLMNEFTPTRVSRSYSLDNTIPSSGGKTQMPTFKAHDDNKTVVAKPSQVKSLTSSAQFVEILNKIASKNSAPATPPPPTMNPTTV